MLQRVSVGEFDLKRTPQANTWCFACFFFWEGNGRPPPTTPWCRSVPVSTRQTDSLAPASSVGAVFEAPHSYGNQESLLEEEGSDSANASALAWLEDGNTEVNDSNKDLDDHSEKTTALGKPLFSAARLLEKNYASRAHFQVRSGRQSLGPKPCNPICLGAQN